FCVHLLTCTAAQFHCDPLTEYEIDDRCCLKCGPGTHMTTSASCEDPDCVECAENEYQETYTYATRCKRQPYCDPNRNFRTSIHSSKNTRAVCMCELGFHCSSDECLTCVPHTACEPGFGAQPKGNHSQDTVCEKCLHGTFSNENSWDGVCHKWTTCEEGYDVVEKGSDVLDNKCAGISTAMIIILLVFMVVSVLTAVHCVEAPVAEKEQLQSEAQNGGITSPEEDQYEDGDKPSSPEGVRTENGNLVTQEDGKSDILSWPESQTTEATV
uniref:Tumor necrosis factor receptor superfamily member 5-like n=1 Tax=Gouania willdenowi TaxID=441366 RepID=A0A8C5HNJ4_GOUWI